MVYIFLLWKWQSILTQLREWSTWSEVLSKHSKRLDLKHCITLGTIIRSTTNRCETHFNIHSHLISLRWLAASYCWGLYLNCQTDLGRSWSFQDIKVWALHPQDKTFSCSSFNTSHSFYWCFLNGQWKVIPLPIRLCSELMLISTIWNNWTLSIFSEVSCYRTILIMESISDEQFNLKR